MNAEITTPRIRLRAPELTDLDAYLELWTDDRVARSMDDFGPRAAAEAEPWLRAAMAERDSLSSLQVTIERTEDAQVVGWLGLGRSSRGVAAWDLGYALHPRFRGHGYASEALTAALGYCVGELGIPDLWGECHADNTASAHVMLTAGMREIAPGEDGQRRFVFSASPSG